MNLLERQHLSLGKMANPSLFRSYKLHLDAISRLPLKESTIKLHLRRLSKNMESSKRSYPSPYKRAFLIFLGGGWFKLAGESRLFEGGKRDLGSYCMSYPYTLILILNFQILRASFNLTDGVNKKIFII